MRWLELIKTKVPFAIATIGKFVALYVWLVFGDQGRTPRPRSCCEPDSKRIAVFGRRFLPCASPSLPPCLPTPLPSFK